MEKGLFGGLFDFNRDGEMSAFERAAEMSFVTLLMEEEAKEELKTELELEGLDFDELSFMDEDERRTAIENAGLDPDDYEFD